MFQNPFFKSGNGSSSPKNSIHSNSQRPSVQDIMNKYKYPQQERQSHVDEQILQSLNESSNFLNEQSRHDKIFFNPIQPQFDLDPPPKKDAIARLTFGEDNKKSQKAQRLLNENDLYDDMSNLRDKVTSMLQRYSVALKAPDQQSKRNIKQQLETDANIVAQEYSQIVDKFNNPDLSAISIADSTIPQHKEQQLTQMFNLVEEFLTKFKNISQQQQEKSQLLRSRINAGESVLQIQQQQQQQLKQTSQFEQDKQEKQFTFSQNNSSKHSSQAVKNKAQAQFAQSITQNYQQTFSKYTSGQSSPTKIIEQQSIPAQQPITQQQLDMTVYQQFPKMDDSFYDQKQISIIRINQKLTALKQKLQEELQKDNMPYTQRILNEMISNLSEIINTQDYQLVKTIIFRIEQGIQQLANNKEGSINLYKYINKALMHSKMKTDLFTQRASMPVNTMTNQLTSIAQHNSYQTPMKFENRLNKINIDRNFEKKERDIRHLEEKNLYFEQRTSAVNKPIDLPKPKQNIQDRQSIEFERKSEIKNYSQDGRMSYQLQFESRPSINVDQRYSSNEPKNIYFTGIQQQQEFKQNNFIEQQKQQFEQRQFEQKSLELIQQRQSELFKQYEFSKQNFTKQSDSMQLQRMSELQSQRTSDFQRQSDQQRPSEQTMKRLFFDAALTQKNKLPSNHPGRTLMVSDLYEDYQKVGGDMQKFIQQQFDRC